MRKSTFYIVFFISLLAACNHPTRLVKVEKQTLVLDNSAPIDSITELTIAPYRNELSKVMDQVLGVSDTPMVKGNPESLLGNFVADLVLHKAGAFYKPADGIPISICLLNNGGLRTSLPKGPITRGKVYELMPFENTLVVLTLSGQKTLELFSFLAKVEGMPVSGATLGIKNKTPVVTLIQGKLVDLNATYKVVTSDYLAAGGDKMEFFNNPINSEPLNYKVRDAIIDYILDCSAAGKKLNSTLDNRIYYVK
jgi:2',3'-cyclic-nucleotide 2'-phosphodiesterase (5'-nucleotidase family)